MLLWHVGASVAIARYAFRDERMDLRFLVVGAVVADLVDTPTGLVWFERLGAVRLGMHSLLAAALVMAGVLVATRRGRPRKRWMPVAVGMLLHLFLDAMWHQPATLWWPLLGIEFSASGAASVTEYISGVVGDWRVWLGEVAGLAYLVALAHRGRLVDRDARHEFFATGRIDVPIVQR